MTLEPCRAGGDASVGVQPELLKDRGIVDGLPGGVTTQSSTNSAP